MTDLLDRTDIGKVIEKVSTLCWDGLSGIASQARIACELTTDEKLPNLPLLRTLTKRDVAFAVYIANLHAYHFHAEHSVFRTTCAECQGSMSLVGQDAEQERKTQTRPWRLTYANAVLYELTIIEVFCRRCTVKRAFLESIRDRLFGDICELCLDYDAERLKN